MVVVRWLAFECLLKTSEFYVASACAAGYDEFDEFVVDYFCVHDFVDFFCFVFGGYDGSAFGAGE